MISRTRPATREMPVAIEKIAVLRATRPPPGGAGVAGSSAKASALADKAAIVRRSAARPAGPGAGRGPRHGKHPFSEEADPALRARALGEPPLHLDDQDLLPPSGSRRRERRRGARVRPP